MKRDLAGARERGDTQIKINNVIAVVGSAGMGRILISTALVNAALAQTGRGFLIKVIIQTIISGSFYALELVLSSAMWLIRTLPAPQAASGTEFL